MPRSGRAPGRSVGALVVGLMAAGGALAGCGHEHAPPARSGSIAVSPQSALLDVPVVVSVRGLPADARTTVVAKAIDKGGVTWTASAAYQANSSGTVSLDQPAQSGGYTGRNPMGLFEFMAPPASDPSATAFMSPKAGYDVTLQAEVNGRVVATAVAHRRTPSAAGVTETDLRPATTHIYGNMYRPASISGKRPAVLVFGGSEGGLDTVTAAASLLAAHGYPALALAYFGEPGLPHTLASIPLEYFVHALSVLRSQPGVDPRHVLVMGASRGGEAALLLGSRYPERVNGVIAAVPSAYVYPGNPDRTKPAWTVGGHPLPTQGPGAVDPRAAIPVEKIAGPVLLTCGGLDTVWSSCTYLDAITGRFSAHHFRHPVTPLRYPDAGHFGAGALIAYFSVTAAADASAGGTLTGNQNARADTHAKLLAFLAAQ